MYQIYHSRENGGRMSRRRSAMGEGRRERMGGSRTLAANNLAEADNVGMVERLEDLDLAKGRYWEL